MPQLIVRRLEKTVVDRLRRRAASRGVSTEEEHRKILREELLGRAVATRPTFKEYLQRIPQAGREDDFARPRSRHRPTRL